MFLFILLIGEGAHIGQEVPQDKSTLGSLDHPLKCQHQKPRIIGMIINIISQGFSMRNKFHLTILLVFLIIFISGCTKQSTKETKEHVIEIVDTPPFYSPVVLNIQPGEKVTWVLKSEVEHPVTIIEGPEKFESSHFDKNWSYTFKEKGVYIYICHIHPYMRGVIGVGQDVPKDKIHAWANWPPSQKQVPGSLPPVSGIGEIWLDAQFEKVEGKEKPGTIVIIDASNWQVVDVIKNEVLNNPHNVWPTKDGSLMLQTNWFDGHVSVFDRISHQPTKSIEVGESPAHVMVSPDGKEAYVTVQGENKIVIIDTETLSVKGKIKVPHSSHGHWLDESGKRMAVAITDLPGRLIVLEKKNAASFHEEEKDEHGVKKEHDEDMDAGMVNVIGGAGWESILNVETDALPLFAAISKDGKYAWTASAVTGEFYVYDVDKKELIKQFNVGKGPIQSVPSPDEKYMLVALSGEAKVAIVDMQNWEIIKKLDSGDGAHAVAYGKKEGGGYYAYISNKFVNWVTVIDMDSLEIAGYIPLAVSSLGGQGIIVWPMPADEIDNIDLTAAKEEEPKKDEVSKPIDEIPDSNLEEECKKQSWPPSCDLVPDAKGKDLCEKCKKLDGGSSTPATETPSMKPDKSQCGNYQWPPDCNYLTDATAKDLCILCKG